MSNLKYLLLSVFMVLIIFLGSAYASDDFNQTDVLNSTQDTLNLEIINDSGTFEDIQTEIDNVGDGATIDLGGYFESKGTEIHINKSLTINGHKNTTLDGKKASCFFYLDHVPKLSVNGVKFINSEFHGDSTTIWNNGYADEYVFTNCVFQNNAGFFLQISSRKATFTNCNFINNDNDLFMLDSDDLTVKNCNFIKNTNQVISRAKTIDKCSFQENTARYFELIDNVQSITNSKFIKNYFILINSVKSMYNNKFESNNWGEYIIAKAGTVDKCVFNKNNMLIFNKFNTLKNSRFENNTLDIAQNGKSVTNCKFIGGKGNYEYFKVSSITNSYFKNIKNCYISGKNLVVKNTDFIKVYGYVVTAKINKCRFSNSDMDVKAGSLTNSKFTKDLFETYAVHAKTVNKCLFTQNKCKTGMMFANTVSNSKFIKNTCNSGLIYIDKIVNSCRFEKNSFAKSKSGEIVGGANLLKNCIFNTNTGKLGSVVCEVNTINGCTFTNNKVTNYGMGTVYFVKKVLNSKFINNKAFRGTGGAIDDVGIVKKCVFKNNYALSGGAISTIGKFTIEKCLFEKNKSKYSGSAIFLTSPVKINGVIKNWKFIKNNAKSKSKTYDVPFKDFKKGTIFAVGEIGDSKIRIAIKNCAGL